MAASITTTLQHPSHDHPLKLVDVSREKRVWFCDLCHRKILSEAYICREGCYYVNHRVCAEAPPRIERHPLHPAHPLTLIRDRLGFSCYACNERFRLSGCSFRCEECDFDLDMCCALSTVLDQGCYEGAGASSELIALASHPHRVTSFFSGYDFVEDCKCVVCWESVDREGCMCLVRSCKFLIHKRCIRDLFNADGTMSTLQHPAHEHPLVSLDLRLQDYHPLCALCYRKIFAKAYTCRKCNYYYNHRVCAEATPKIECHPLHPAHPLSLSHLRSSFNCYACGENRYASRSSFRCNECDFDLDICCALCTLTDQGASLEGTPPEHIIHPLHPHPLTSFCTRHDFVEGNRCELCRGSVEGGGYVCLRRCCKFLIHKSCIQDLYYADGTKAPHIYHFHQLEILLGEDEGSTNCKFCGSDESGEFIGCASCRVFYHRNCIQMPEILQYPNHLDHTLVLFVDPLDHRDPKCRSCSCYMKDYELRYGCLYCSFFVHVGCALRTLAYCAEGMSSSIKWTWHEHPLLLGHGNESDLKNCDYCVDKSSGPIYTCQLKYCTLLLHKQCTEIGSTIVHPHHPEHPLAFQHRDQRPPLLCAACCSKIYGFSFSCDICPFYLHSMCAARRPARKHYLHEHKLICLDKAPSLECNRCSTSTDSSFFRCVPCNFNLHEKCAELPLVIKTKIHWHPLTLHETYMEDDSGEYYCDHCEERRDGQLGVYVCIKCSARWAYHVECILPELRKVFEKGKTSAVERLDEQIEKKSEEVRAAEEKLVEVKRELDELMKRRLALTSGEEKY